MPSKPFVSAIVLPQCWKDRGVAVRPYRKSDAKFVQELFCSVRGPEFVRLGWPESVLRDFLAGQSQLQNHHYANAYPNASHLVVTQNGVAIGRLVLFASPGDLRIVDIALLPEYRGDGLGAALLQAIMRQAAKLPASISLSVDLANPARQLYLRQGFVGIHDNGIAQEMRLSL